MQSIRFPEYCRSLSSKAFYFHDVLEFYNMVICRTRRESSRGWELLYNGIVRVTTRLLTTWGLRAELASSCVDPKLEGMEVIESFYHMRNSIGAFLTSHFMHAPALQTSMKAFAVAHNQGGITRSSCVIFQFNVHEDRQWVYLGTGRMIENMTRTRTMERRELRGRDAVQAG